jgi:hypothetical protein
MIDRRQMHVYGSRRIAAQYAPGLSEADRRHHGHLYQMPAAAQDRAVVLRRIRGLGLPDPEWADLDLTPVEHMQLQIDRLAARLERAERILARGGRR